jgi:hypothetical protein
MNDNPAASMIFWFAASTKPRRPRSSRRPGGERFMNAGITRIAVVVSAVLPSNALTIRGNPAVSEQANGGLRFLAEPGLAEPVPGVSLEVQGGHAVEHQTGRP